MRIKTVAEKLEESRGEVKARVEKLVANEMSHYAKMSVSDLISQCNDAVKKMGTNNPHKILIYNCAMCIRQLVDRLEKHENPQGVEQPQQVV